MRTALILSLTVFMLHYMALDQLLKLPTLAAHFLEHKQRDNTIGIGDFFSMHYWGKDINDNDDERDRQLPFKSMNIHHFHHAFVPLSKNIVLKPVCYLSSQTKYPSLNDNDILNPASTVLFRPPRA